MSVDYSDKGSIHTVVLVAVVKKVEVAVVCCCLEYALPRVTWTLLPKTQVAFDFSHVI